MAGMHEREVGTPNIQNTTMTAAAMPEVRAGSAFNATGSFVQRALAHLQEVSGFDGLPAEFQAQPQAATTSGGGVVVHMQQQFKSIPIFLMARTVRFGSGGELQDSTGASITLSDDLSVEPRVTVQQAVLEAAKHTAEVGQGLLGEPDDFGNALDAPEVDVTGFQPKVIAAFQDFAPRPTVVEGGPFGFPIKANLTWYPADSTILLAWEIILTMPQGAGQYRVIVDANSAAILYSRQLVDLLTGRALVYLTDGTARQTVAFPRPWSDYAAAFDPGTLPLGVPPQPADWVDDMSQDTFGNFVSARLGDSGSSLRGRSEGGTVVFEPQLADGDDQKVLNIFYFNNYLHDVFYLLGFREQDGNFQMKGVGGIPGDPVDARAHSGPVWGTANMFTPPDGTSPTMNMGLVAGTGRHTAFDASVVFHEYMHGVTNRLVGGPMNTKALELPQSKAMGEGWGDYIACTILGTNVVGSWVTNQPGGIRSHPYDESYPGTYGRIGTGIYVSAHKVGEIWCATLLAMNRNLNLRLGTPRGQRLALQLVVDALKLAPANPNFLDMRDAILLALDHKRQASPGLSSADFEAARAGAWAAFAKYGMGARARSDDGGFGGIVEDFTPGTGGPAPSPAGTPSGTTSPTGGVGSAGGRIRLQSSDRIVIPDNAPAGISRILNAGIAGAIKTITVHVDIGHTYVADLLVRLVPPVGPAIVLHNQAFKDTPDLVVKFSERDRLSGLVGQQAQGDWMLTVADLSAGDEGALRAWGIEIEIDGANAFAGDTDATSATGPAEAALLLQELSAIVSRLAGVIGPR